MIDEELHLGPKDFKVEWYSGTGAGGQHRNKHQNCCRITHIATGLKAQSTEHKDRPSNQKQAFTKLANLILAHFYDPDPVEREKTREVIRNYHGVRNEVLDKKSGVRDSYTEVVEKGKAENVIDARRKACLN